MIDGRRLMMRALRSGGSGITTETVNYVPQSLTYSHTIPINGDVNKILFVHFYDADAVMDTVDTTYEGCKIGPALSHFSEVSVSSQWTFYRINSTGAQKGYNTYGNTPAFDTDGIIDFASNPRLAVGHNIVFTIFYAE